MGGLDSTDCFMCTLALAHEDCPLPRPIELALVSRMPHRQLTTCLFIVNEQGPAIHSNELWRLDTMALFLRSSSRRLVTNLDIHATIGIWCGLPAALSSTQLDVGFLAMLGEDAVKKMSRLASLSWVFLLPRLVPGPHSLPYSEWPKVLDVYRASVCSACSGDVRDRLFHVAGAMVYVLHLFRRWA